MIYNILRDECRLFETCATISVCFELFNKITILKYLQSLKLIQKMKLKLQ